jgi:hypothetical protein
VIVPVKPANALKAFDCLTNLFVSEESHEPELGYNRR